MFRIAICDKTSALADEAVKLIRSCLAGGGAVRENAAQAFQLGLARTAALVGSVSHAQAAFRIPRRGRVPARVLAPARGRPAGVPARGRTRSASGSSP